MAYLVVYSRGQVLARQAISESLTTIGRSADCNVVVHDILLSRSHCRIDKTDAGFELCDLHSKNGTVIDGQRVSKQFLHDGDVIRLGKTLIKFYTDEMPPALVEGARKPRPADPTESLASTVWGMTLEAELPEMPDRFAAPRPAPPLPAAYEREKIHQMLEEIASSSWDSIYAESRNPTRDGDITAVPDRPRQRPARPDGVCLSLQVNGDVLHSFAKHQSRRKRTVVKRGMNKVLRTAYKISPWIALLSVLKAA